MNAQSKREIVAEWNSGELGCGMFVVELSRKFKALRTGQLLQVTSLNLGAPRDIPAWCRVTGHVLVLANHPDYIIEKKGD